MIALVRPVCYPGRYAIPEAIYLVPLNQVHKRLFFGWVFVGFPVTAGLCWITNFNIITVLLINLGMSAYTIAMEHWIAMRQEES